MTAKPESRPRAPGAPGECAEAIGLALLPDPFYRSITAGVAHSDRDRMRMLERYLAYSLDEARRTGRCVLAEPPGRGGAAWLLPRDAELERTESRAKAAFMQQTLGPEGYRNYRAIIGFMSPLAERLVPAHAWYLSIVGVHPDDQGRGLGERLLQPTLREARENGVPCYLETFTPRNVPFYERLGFSTIAEYHEPTTDANYLVMRREG